MCAPASTRRTNADAVTTPRGSVRRLLDVWGAVPGFGPDGRDAAVVTRDGVRLAATLLPGPAAERPPAAVPAVVVVHGFAGHRRKPAYAYLAERLSEVAAVLAVDLRGHGGSAGRCTFGDREALDVRAACAWARRAGHRWVAAVGASMGGLAALRAAGTAPPGAVDAVCAISAPAEWGCAETPAAAAILRLAGSPWRRQLLGAAARLRIAGAWGEPAPVLDVVARARPRPVLVVHGVDDHYFGLAHGRRLSAAAGAGAVLWEEPAGFGHAEDGITPAFADRLVAALPVVQTTGAWPQRASTPPSASATSSASRTSPPAGSTPPSSSAQ